MKIFDKNPNIQIPNSQQLEEAEIQNYQSLRHCGFDIENLFRIWDLEFRIVLCEWSFR